MSNETVQAKEDTHFNKPLHKQLRKTRLCTYHLTSQCQYKSSCAFAHSLSELQQSPDLWKTQMCQAFVKDGSCANPECNFAHGEDELRLTDPFYKKSQCMWFEKGKCRNGEKCRFAHGSHERRTDKEKVSASEPMQVGYPSLYQHFASLSMALKKASGADIPVAAPPGLDKQEEQWARTSTVKPAKIASKLFLEPPETIPVVPKFLMAGPPGFVEKPFWETSPPPPELPIIPLAAPPVKQKPRQPNKKSTPLSSKAKLFVSCFTPPFAIPGAVSSPLHTVDPQDLEPVNWMSRATSESSVTASTFEDDFLTEFSRQVSEVGKTSTTDVDVA
jgi:hypothetical protein